MKEDPGGSVSVPSRGSISPLRDPSSLSLQPFRCAHCHYSCNISGSLKRHYNRKHPSEEYANVGTGELAAEALIQQGRWGPSGPALVSCDQFQLSPDP